MRGNWEAYGLMKIEPLVEDKLIIVDEKQKGVCIAFKNWLTCKWMTDDSLFIGMHKDGLPCGFVRVVSSTGEFYEGNVSKNFAYGTYGWGRELSGDYVRLGSW